MSSSSPTGSQGASGDRIPASCPYEDCGTSFRLAPELRGRKVKCPKCQRRFVVSPTPGAPSQKVDDERARQIEDPTRKLAAADALEPISKGEPQHPAPKDDALEPSRPSGAAEAAAPAPGGPPSPSLSLGGELSLDLPETPETPEPAPSPPPTPKKPTSPPVNVAGVLGDDEGEPDEPEMEMSLDKPYEKPKPLVSETEFEPEEPQEPCPQCGVPINEEANVCVVCGHRKGAPVQKRKAGEQEGGGGGEEERKKTGFVTKLLTLVILAGLAYGGHWFWKRSQAVGTQKAFEELKGMTKVVGSKVSGKPVESEPVAPDTVVLCGEDELTLEDASRPMTVRRNQPMLQKDSKDGRILVAVKTPSGEVEGWVPAESIRAAEEAVDPVDLLGFDESKGSGHSKPVADLRFDKECKFAASIAEGGREVSIWNVEMGKCVRTFHAHKKPVKAVAFMENGCMASVSEEVGVRIWDPLTTATLKKYDFIKNEFALWKDGIHCVEFASTKLKLWNLVNGSAVTSSPSDFVIKEFRISRNREVILVLDNERYFRVLSLPKFKVEDGFLAPLKMKGFDMSRSGKYIVVCMEGSSEVPIFETGSRQKVREIELQGTPYLARFCGKGTYVGVVPSSRDRVAIYSIASARTSRMVKVLDASDGEEISTIVPSADASVLAIGYANGAVEFQPFLSSKKDDSSGGSKPTKPDRPKISPEEKEARRHHTMLKGFLMNKQPDRAKEYYQKLLEKCPDSPYTAKAFEALKAAGVEATPPPSPKEE